MRINTGVQSLKLRPDNPADLRAKHEWATHRPRSPVLSAKGLEAADDVQ